MAHHPGKDICLQARAVTAGLLPAAAHGRAQPRSLQIERDRDKLTCNRYCAHNFCEKRGASASRTGANSALAAARRRRGRTFSLTLRRAG